jgi:phosphoribosylanthranilate isomerase
MPGMGVKAKICGISTPEAVTAALDGGAGWLGFMFFAKSPRNLAPDAAARLAQPVRGQAKIVAVLVDPDDAEVDRVAQILKPDLIQLHGAETPARARAIGVRAATGIIKALPVSEPSNLAAAAQYETVVEHLMFEGKPAPNADRPGGGGQAFDWTLLSGRRFQRPWFLAGGLDPWNLGEAVQQSGAPLVDVSSGVERGPGLKDPALIRAFLDAAKSV